MRLLVTGASGYVGRQFLVSTPGDWQITYLGRSEVVDASARWVNCDLSSVSSAKAAAAELRDETFDAIIHLAAAVPKTAAEDTLENALNGNIHTTVNLLQYLGELAPKLIIGSTAEVYDPAKIKGAITEDNVVAGGSYYGSTKMSSELIVQSYAKKHDKELTILRFSVMYGGYDPIARALPNFIRAAKSGQDITVHGARVLRDYIHVDDVVRSIICAVNSDGAGVVNIGTGRGVSIEAAARSISEIMQSSSKINIESQTGDVDIVIDIAKARRLLDFQPQVLFPDKLDQMITLYD